MPLVGADGPAVLDPMSAVELGTIETAVPSRLDRLPWSRFHWRIVFGLGTAWILDGLEVTMVGSVASRLTEKAAGLGLSLGDVGVAAAVYITGSCLGALFFGQLCDRFGRKKLFIITLSLYIISTVVTAFSFAPWFFFVARFLTGAGIGGEYSAVNSAIDELIPARARGRIDLAINGSYWLGSIIGSGFALFFLSSIFPVNLGWRLAFGVGAVIGLSVMFVRRKVPESPRWLFIHGHEDEAEAIVGDVEDEVESETGQDLSEVTKTITVRQRTTIPFRELARVAYQRYSGRSVLCLALFVGQAFIYNGITFNLGTLMTTFYGIGSSIVPVFLIAYALGNFAGPLLLGRLFDTIGRKPMISGTYLGSAVLAVVLAALFDSGSLNDITFILVVVGVFFLASAGASAAYLTASEIFPMETRALAIAFFYAIGTAVGGITGPLLFGKLIATDHRGDVAIAFLIGAAVMAVGGVAELVLGVKAARKQLEDVAEPLTVDDAEEDSSRPEEDATAPNGTDEPEPGPERTAARHERELAALERACAAEHRATAHDLLAATGGDGNGSEAAEQAEVERLLGEVAETTARAHDERAAAADARVGVEDEDEAHLADAGRERALAAEERDRVHEQRAEALTAEHGLESERHRSLAASATERARSREQRALAEQARAAVEGMSGEQIEVRRTRAQMHEAWAEVHARRAEVHQAQSARDADGEALATTAAEMAEERAKAANDRVDAAERLSEAEHERRAEDTAEEVGRRRSEAAARQLSEERHQASIERRPARDRAGLRRFRPGPGQLGAARAFAVSTPIRSEQALDAEVRAITEALDEHGPTERRTLAQLVGARYWGPGVFGEVLGQAIATGEVQRVAYSTFARSGGRPDGHDRDGSTRDGRDLSSEQR